MSKKFKILLAEDDPFLIRYIRTMLSRWDCELAVEPTGADAIRRAATFKPDVALLGLTPGMERVQVGIGLLRISPGTQIVLFNGFVPVDILSDLRAQGYEFRTLAAPFDKQKLWDLCFHPITKRNRGTFESPCRWAAGLETQTEIGRTGIFSLADGDLTGF